MGKRDDLYDNEAVPAKARSSIHKTIIDWFQQHKPGKILDAPAGPGHLSMKLRDMGYDVVSGEIEPHIFRVPDLECIFCDLNTTIDAPDNSFDYVCCVDGLEHMTNPYRAVEEFSRCSRKTDMGFSVSRTIRILKKG